MDGIRAFRDEDGPAVVALWDGALGASWPLRGDRLLEALRACEVLVAEGVGLVAARRDGTRGAVTAIAVDPAWQRRGVGSRLLDAVLASLGRSGVTEVTLGSGAGAYLWPGVPGNLPAANAFFDAGGWSRGAPVADLRGEIRGFQAPAAVLELAAGTGVVFALAGREDAPGVLSLQERHFPHWRDDFRRRLETPGGVLHGRMPDGAVVATCTLDDGDEYPFAALLGDRVGAVGDVGVDPAVRGRGIGLALVARATELLAGRGYERCFVGYTHLAEWYGRLGFEPWRGYRMGAKTLGQMVGR